MEGDTFIHQIATGDKTWIHHYELANTTIWKENTFQKKHKSQSTSEKVMLIIFWCSPEDYEHYHEGSILQYYHKQSVAIKSTHCSKKVHDKLKLIIQRTTVTKCYNSVLTVSMS